MVSVAIQFRPLSRLQVEAQASSVELVRYPVGLFVRASGGLLVATVGLPLRDPGGSAPQTTAEVRGQI
eukprot:6392584-Pyramimonas_sp.AAC.1